MKWFKDLHAAAQVALILVSPLLAILVLPIAFLCILGGVEMSYNVPKEDKKDETV